MAKVKITIPHAPKALQPLVFIYWFLTALSESQLAGTEVGDEKAGQDLHGVRLGDAKTQVPERWKRSPMSRESHYHKNASH